MAPWRQCAGCGGQRVYKPGVGEAEGWRVRWLNSSLAGCMEQTFLWVQNCFGFVFSVLDIFFGSVFLPVFFIFFAICSILELEAAISTVFATFWNWNFSFSIGLPTFWWNF